jgi:hypothetical protein
MDLARGLDDRLRTSSGRRVKSFLSGRSGGNFQPLGGWLT